MQVQNLNSKFTFKIQVSDFYSKFKYKIQIQTNKKSGRNGF